MLLSTTRRRALGSVSTQTRSWSHEGVPRETTLAVLKKERFRVGAQRIQALFRGCTARQFVAQLRTAIRIQSHDHGCMRAYSLCYSEPLSAFSPVFVATWRGSS